MIKIIPGTYEIKSPKKGGYSAHIVSVEVMDDGVRKMITYWEQDGKYGSEVYQGPNYVKPFDSKNPSYSRNYISLKGIPQKYMQVIVKLAEIHQKKFPNK